MSTTIWQYRLDSLGPTKISIPGASKILSVGEQGGYVCFWAEVNPTEPMRERTFAVYGTGHSMPDDPGKYLGTAMNRGGMLGMLVYHLYEQEG